MYVRRARATPSSTQRAFVQPTIHFDGLTSGVRCLEVEGAATSRMQRAAKRGTDIALSLVLLCLLAPLLAAIALMIRLDSAGPVLFRQQRRGHRGRVFAILKFRTMTVCENGAEVKQARRNDPRVARVGRWLRSTSLDELPQLINVIRGEMSLVGPRPHAVSHDELYASLIERYELRQRVKPGITGWAQVNGLRGETATVDRMRQRVNFDIWYVRNASPSLDIRILFRTVFVVLSRRDAH